MKPVFADVSQHICLLPLHVGGRVKCSNKEVQQPDAPRELARLHEGNSLQQLQSLWKLGTSLLHILTFLGDDYKQLQQSRASIKCCLQHEHMTSMSNRQVLRVGACMARAVKLNSKP